MPAVPLVEIVYSQLRKNQVRNVGGRKQSVEAGAGQSPYVAEKDKKAFSTDLKNIYHSPSEQTGFERMEAVADKWWDK